MQKRQTFSKEFKQEAVRLLKTTDKPAADLTTLIPGREKIDEVD